MTGRKTILVVEDNELNRLMLCSILNEKYYVLQAENGKIALDILEGNKDKISLILLDIVMPVMDGYTFLSAVKANPDYSSPCGQYYQPERIRRDAQPVSV